MLMSRYEKKIEVLEKAFSNERTQYNEKELDFIRNTSQYKKNIEGFQHQITNLRNVTDSQEAEIVQLLAVREENDMIMHTQQKKISDLKKIVKLLKLKQNKELIKVLQAVQRMKAEHNKNRLEIVKEVEMYKIELEKFKSICQINLPHLVKKQSD